MPQDRPKKQKQTGPMIDRSVLLDEQRELKFWSKKLGVPAEQLKQAAGGRSVVSARELATNLGIDIEAKFSEPGDAIGQGG